MSRKILLVSIAVLIPLATAGHNSEIRERSFPEYTQVNEIKTDNFRKLDRFKNPSFTDYRKEVEKKADFESWNENHGSTHHIGVSEEGWNIDGPTAKTRWVSNGFGATASISQEINLTGVDSIKLDATGTKGNSRRSKIILEVDENKEGVFIKSPQSRTSYRNLGVDLGNNYEGTHRVKIKWVQIRGDNIGNSGIDNVRAMKNKNQNFEPNNTLVNRSEINPYSYDSEGVVRQPRAPKTEMPSVSPSLNIQKLLKVAAILIL